MVEKQKKQIVEAEAKALYAELNLKKITKENEPKVNEDLEQKKKVAGVIKSIIRSDNQEKEKLAEKKVSV